VLPTSTRTKPPRLNPQPCLWEAAITQRTLTDLRRYPIFAIFCGVHTGENRRSIGHGYLGLSYSCPPPQKCSEEAPLGNRLLRIKTVLVAAMTFTSRRTATGTMHPANSPAIDGRSLARFLVRFEVAEHNLAKLRTPVLHLQRIVCKSRCTCTCVHYGCAHESRAKDPNCYLRALIW
jgi:hypothetical protein